ARLGFDLTQAMNRSNRRVASNHNVGCFDFTELVLDGMCACQVHHSLRPIGADMEQHNFHGVESSAHESGATPRRALPISWIVGSVSVGVRTRTQIGSNWRWRAG